MVPAVRALAQEQRLPLGLFSTEEAPGPGRVPRRQTPMLLFQAGRLSGLSPLRPGPSTQPFIFIAPEKLPLKHNKGTKKASADRGGSVCD